MAELILNDEEKALNCGATWMTRRYVSEWKKLTEAVEKKLDARVYAFDPGVAVCLPDGRGSATLPLWVAKKIAGLDV